MGQLGGIGDDVVVFLRRGELEAAEPQAPGKVPYLIQAALRRARVGRQNQGRPLEQLRKGGWIPGALDARHGVPPHEPEPRVLHHVRQRRTDHALHAAAVHDRAALPEMVPVGRDILHRCLGVEGNHHQSALRQPVRRQGGGHHPLVQSPAEYRAVCVIAQDGAVRILTDGLGHAASNKAQAHNAHCLNHKRFLPF